MKPIPMKRVMIDDATDEQIVAYCQAMGLDTPDGAKRADALAQLGLIADLMAMPWILAPDVPDTLNDALVDQIDAMAAPAQQRLEGGFGDSDPTIRIKITSTPMPGGKHPVAVGVNGKVAVLQRDQTIDLPIRYFFALENAVAAEITQNLTTGEITETLVNNYPVQVIGWPDGAEVRAWRSKVDDTWCPA